MWFVYGDCYAAHPEVYTRIGRAIKSGLQNIGDIALSETKELGCINRVDPLGITNLRVRGMWHIDNPLKVYERYYKFNDENSFCLACVMRREKYDSFDKGDKDELAAKNGISISDIEIKDPDNPAKRISAKLITLEVS